MDSEHLPAFAAFLEQFPTAEAGKFTGKRVTLRLVGAPKMLLRVILLGYDAAGIHVKDTSGGMPEESDFHLWHTIENITAD